MQSVVINVNTGYNLSNIFLGVQEIIKGYQCKRMTKTLKRRSKLGQDPRIVYMYFQNKDLRISNLYVMCRGYNDDGSLTPLTKYTKVNNRILADKTTIQIPVLALDLYEYTLYLYDVTEKDGMIEGFVMKDRFYKGTDFIIFSDKRVKLDVRNINGRQIYQSIEDILNTL